MELRDIDLNLLLVFNQLLIDRRVSAAAKNLGISQPAFSNALKRLRNTLQDELFVRTYRGMEPTPYAEQLAEPVSAAIGLLHGGLSRPASFDPLTSERVFTLATSDIGEFYCVPQLVEAFARRAPGCRLRTVQNNTDMLAEGLQSGTIDLAVGLLPHLQAGYYQRRLFQHRYVCLCRKGHPLVGESMSIEQFCSYDHVRVESANTGHGELDAHMARAGIHRSIRVEVPHFVTAAYLLQRTDLLTTVPKRFADACLKPFELVDLALPEELPPIDINLFWHTRYHRDPANRWFRELIFELFSDGGRVLATAL